MHNDDKTRIIHMIESAQSAQEFIADKSFADLRENKQLAFAIIRALEILGEAAAQTSQELRDSYPDIQWRDIISMRNKLIHAYFGVDLNMVWTVVKEELPPCRPAIVTLLARLDDQK